MRRLRPGPRAADGLVALFAFVVGAVESTLSDANSSVALRLLVAGVVAAPLLLRRGAIAWASAAYVGAIGLHVVVDAEPDAAGAPWLVGMLLAYAAGRHARRHRGVPELVGVLAGVEWLWAAVPGLVVGDLVFPVVFTVVAWAAGHWVRYDVRLNAELNEEAARVLERGERERERARADERRRIAREMHDVIAHSVSVMVVQAGGGRRILATDPDRAVEAAALAERTGREALSELRTLLGVIGAEPERSGAPAPSLTRLDDLVGRARGAGLEIEVDADDLDALPAGLDMAAYRIVQEALTNALRHAGRVPARVELRRERDALSIEVVNVHGEAGATAGLTRPGGHGMLGMAERAGLYGGVLDAGPTPGGGFRVATRLSFEDRPVEGVA